MKPDKKLIVFGAGGHGRVVADAARHAGWTVAGFVDDSPAAGSCHGLSLPLLGDRTSLRKLPRDSYMVALGIGDNHARMEAARFLVEEKFEMATIVSRSAVISPSARIGEGSVILQGADVEALAIVGEGVIVNSGSIVGHDVRVGNYANLCINVTLGGGAEVGELAFIGIGANVLPLLRVGRRSVLGAGSIATREIPEDVVAFGSPARVKRKLLLDPETGRMIDPGSKAKPGAAL